MKFTQYFLFTRERPDRQEIKLEWIEQVFNHPEKEEIQSDGRVRRWAKILENQKYLRIVLLEDGVTIHNAFFDRSFKPGN
jgi:predicted ATPase